LRAKDDTRPGVYVAVTLLKIVGDYDKVLRSSLTSNIKRVFTKQVKLNKSNMNVHKSTTTAYNSNSIVFCKMENAQMATH